jgi:hypothetical protein
MARTLVTSSSGEAAVIIRRPAAELSESGIEVRSVSVRKAQPPRDITNCGTRAIKCGGLSSDATNVNIFHASVRHFRPFRNQSNNRTILVLAQVSSRRKPAAVQLANHMAPHRYVVTSARARPRAGSHSLPYSRI